MGEEISVDLNPAVDFDFERLDEVSEIDFDPGLFNWSLYFGDFDLYLFEIGDFLVEEVEIGYEFSAAFK